MFNKLPELIDPIYSVNHDKRFTGRVNQSRLKRVVEAVNDADREVDVQLDFFYDKALRFPAFIMKIETSLSLQCQRSLKIFDLPVSTEVKGIFAESLALTDDLPADVEIYELDPENEKVSPLLWIEEELLLCVPLAPVDSSSEAPQYDGLSAQGNNNSKSFVEDEAQKPNPFAVLQGLKK